MFSHPMLTQWIAQAVAMMVTAFLLPGLRITSLFGAMTTIVALSFVNSNIWDTALFFSIPLDFTSHTLTVVAANAVLFWVLVKVLPGIEIRGITSALLAPILFSAFTIFLTPICQDIDWEEVSHITINKVTDVRDSLKETKRPKAASLVPEGD